MTTTTNQTPAPASNDLAWERAEGVKFTDYIDLEAGDGEVDGVSVAVYREGDKPEQYPDKLLGDVEICRWWGVGKVAGHWHEKALVTWDDGRRELMRRIDQAEARAALLARCPTLGALLG